MNKASSGQCIDSGNPGKGEPCHPARTRGQSALGSGPPCRTLVGLGCPLPGVRYPYPRPSPERARCSVIARLHEAEDILIFFDKADIYGMLWACWVCSYRIMTERNRLIEAIEQNSRRLLTDAEISVRLRRTHTSVGLAVQALEEFGKALILRWGVKNLARKGALNHIDKQAATFALLSANELLEKNGKLLARLLKRDGVDLSNVGYYSNQFCCARGGFFENLRMSVTYEDEVPVFPSEVIEALKPGVAKDIIGFTKKARLASRNSEAMKLASVFYTHNHARM